VTVRLATSPGSPVGREAKRLATREADRARPESSPSRSATVGGRAETLPAPAGYCQCPWLATSPGGNHDELGAAFWYGLDDRALPRGQIAVACHAGEPW
jgi:hypothetical protein